MVFTETFLCRYLYRGQTWYRDAEPCQILTFCDGENEMRYKVRRRRTRRVNYRASETLFDI